MSEVMEGIVPSAGSLPPIANAGRAAERIEQSDFPQSEKKGLFRIIGPIKKADLPSKKVVLVQDPNMTLISEAIGLENLKIDARPIVSNLPPFDKDETANKAIQETLDKYQYMAANPTVENKDTGLETAIGIFGKDAVDRYLENMPK